jgi:hypothetical protein
MCSEDLLAVLAHFVIDRLTCAYFINVKINSASTSVDCIYKPSIMMPESKERDFWISNIPVALIIRDIALFQLS